MTTNRPLDITPPPPPSAPGGAALPLPTVEPCNRCDTTGGFIPPDMVRPTRIQGYCRSCYATLRARRDQHGLTTPEEAAALPPVNPGLQKLKLETVTASAHQRAALRQQAIRDHVGPFITTVAPVPYPAPIRLPVDPSYDQRDGRSWKRWQPAPWADSPTQITLTPIGYAQQREAA